MYYTATHMIGNAIDFLFTLRMRMRMRIEYELGLREEPLKRLGRTLILP